MSQDKPPIQVLGDNAPIILARSTPSTDRAHQPTRVTDDALIPGGAPLVYEVIRRLECVPDLPPLELTTDGAPKGDARASVRADPLRATRAIVGQGQTKNRGVRIFRFWPPQGRAVSNWESEPPGEQAWLIVHGEFTQRIRGQLDLSRKGVIWILDGSLPAWPEAAERKHPKSCPQSDEQLIVITSLATLQRGGAVINGGLSWEQLIEDLCAELNLLPPLRALTSARHVLVRVGLTGIVHIENSKGGRAGTLHFVPDGPPGASVDGEGLVVGKNAIIGARVLEKLAAGPVDGANWRQTLENALFDIRFSHAIGYDFPDEDGRGQIERGEAILTSAFARILHARDETSPSSIVSVTIPPHVLQMPSPGSLRGARTWRMLDEALEKTPFHRANVALAIVKFGDDKVLNASIQTDDEACKELQTLTRYEYWIPQDSAPDFLTLQEGDYPAIPHPDEPVPPLADTPILGRLGKEELLPVPVARFGKLHIAEREEIEAVRSIEQLFRKYIKKNDASAKPLSVAVFGRPGSGKSFAVKQICATIDAEGRRTRIMEYNLAQFRTPGDLAFALRAVGGASHEVTPVVFFDEFDCALGGERLGWLQFFLAPMQDGKFYAEHQTVELGRAIFVFAGGVNESFEQFDPRPRLPDQVLGLRAYDEYQQRVREFADRKGPDFISRLRGHINVLELNDGSGRRKHLVRRALQLRGLLTQHGLVDEGGALVDDEILYAMLTVDRYRHGVRSMEALLDSCTLSDGRVTTGDLPSQAQLNMHVDAEEFLRRVYRGRIRSRDPAYQHRRSGSA